MYEEQRLRVFENSVLRSIFEPKRDEVMGRWRKHYNEELRDIRMVKSRRIRWAVHVVQMGGKEKCV
jgi:hypothetical protein